ncbi:hypothetical protein G9A89_012417 [Geosiphon pyriformis]|nr:hypothetical protein G9A89_012417 [Geosiphon pyriformis]
MEDTSSIIKSTKRYHFSYPPSLPVTVLFMKKVVLENIKHLSNEKDIFLNKFELGDNMFFDMDSLSDDDKNANMTGINVGSLLDLAVNTSKAKHVNTGANFGFPLGFPNFVMDNDENVSLPFCLPISLEKKCIDLKIIKTQIEVFAKKSFALDINLSAVKEKSAMAKTQLIRKIFSSVNSFGGVTTLSKFEEIIQSTFISEKNMNMAMLLAREKGIDINSNLKRQGIHSDWAVVIKKIFMNTLKKMIVTALAEFALRDWFRALLFTLPMRMTAHNLGTFLEKAGGKTCIINHLLDFDNKIHCAVIGFKSKNAMESAYRTELIFSSVKLSWTRLDLVCCKRCGFFGHSALECGALLAFTPKSSKVVRKVALEEHCFWLAKLYAKKTVPIFDSATFDSKSWAQIMLFNSFSDGSSPCVVFSVPFGSGLFSGARISLVISAFPSDSVLHDCLSSLEHSLKLLADQVFDILRKLSYIELVPLASLSLVLLPIAFTSLVMGMDSDMTLDDVLIHSIPLLMVVTNIVANISLSNSKILTTKVEGLESKMVALEVSVESILERLDCLCSGLVWKFATCNVRDINVPTKQENIVCWHKKSGNMIINKFDGIWIFTSGLGVGFLSAGVAIIINSFLAQHVSKVDKIPGQLIFVHLLFKDKLSVTILDLYAGASADTRFGQASSINSLISRAANSSSFMVVGGDFNENGSKRSASFKFCSDLGLVNIFNEHSLAKASTWSNSRGVEKVLDFIFVSKNLTSTIILHKVNDVITMATTPDTTTLEYYQSIYTHCKQRFNISDGIEVVKKSNLILILLSIVKKNTQTETSNKGKQKVKQYSRTTPNTPILPKTTAKHLQTPEQETSTKLPLSITPFLISLAQSQTPNLPLNHFFKPEDFQSPRNPIQQQEPILTSTNIIEYLQKNKSNHSKNLESEETESESEEIIKNEKEMTTTYIAKIPEFIGEDNDTSPQEWFDKFENLEDPFENWQAFKDAFLQQFTNNNTSITLYNCFCNIKQEISETFIAGLKDKLIKKVCPHAPADLSTVIRHTKNYEIAMKKANHTKLVNLAIRETSSTAKKKIDQLTKKISTTTITQPKQLWITIQQPTLKLSLLWDLRTLETRFYYQPAPQSMQQQYQQSLPIQQYQILLTQQYQVPARRLLVLRNSGQQKPNYYHTQPSKIAAPRSNPSNNTIPPAQIVQNANLSDIFPFEFEANKLPFLLSNTAANKQKAITAMYTEATLMQQFQKTVDRPAQTVIVTANGMKKTPVEKIDNFLFTINGITISVKVLVMDASQYQALELKISYQGQYTIVLATSPVFEFEEKKEMPLTETYMAIGLTSNWTEKTERKFLKNQEDGRKNMKLAPTTSAKHAIENNLNPQKEVENGTTHLASYIDVAIRGGVCDQTCQYALSISEKVRRGTLFDAACNSALNKLYHYPYDAEMIFDLAMALINRAIQENVRQMKKAEYIKYTMELAGFNYKDKVETYHQIASHTYPTQEAQIQ